jgi:hypothetical protein
MQPKITDFTCYELSEKETLRGQLLNSDNILVIQNMLSDVSINLINCRFDPQNPGTFVQDQAFLAGQRSILTLLLENHKAAQELLR